MRGISLSLCIFALAGLFILGRLATGYDNLYFAGSKHETTVPVEKGLDLNITWETATLDIDIGIISVNQNYGRIMGYEMKSGSFFTRSTLEEKRSNTVLNEKLAFDTFGSFDIVGNTYKIRGEPYIVVGVADDRRDESVAYIPAQTTAGSFLAIIDTEEKTVADLKSLGISENRFHLVNLGEISQSLRNKPWLALMGAGIILVTLLLYKTTTRIRALFTTLRQMNRDKYLGELIKTGAARKFFAFTLAGIAETAALLLIILKSAEIILHWAEHAGSLTGVGTPAFGGMIMDLQNLCLYSNILLGIFVGGALIGIISIKRYHQNLRQ